MAEAQSMDGDAPNWASTLAYAREKWSRAEPIVESRGRPPKRSKYARFRTQEQRVFAAAILRSVGIYEGLTSHRNEIRAMLCARNFIDESMAIPHGHSVRPEATVDTPEAAADWLQENTFVGTCVPSRSRALCERTAGGELKVRLVDDSAAPRLDNNGKRPFHSHEQLIAWVIMWADRRLELRWLCMELGFGIFRTAALPSGKSIKLEGIADYDVRDPHASIELHATASDRAHGDHSHDKISVYGPITLINAACEAHATFRLADEDLGVGGKRVRAKPLMTEGGALKHRLAESQQVCAPYAAPKGQCWKCLGGGPQRQCRYTV